MALPEVPNQKTSVFCLKNIAQGPKHQKNVAQGRNQVKNIARGRKQVKNVA